jgi:hypothetical protein
MMNFIDLVVQGNIPLFYLILPGINIAVFMNYKFLPITLKSMFLHPGKAWDIINSENITTSDLRNGFLIPFIVLISISAYAGSVLFVNSELSALYSVMTAVQCFIVIFLSVYATSLILSKIATRLDIHCENAISFRLIVFSSVPFMTCQLLSRLFESFLFINILAFFGLYIFWIGAEKLLNPPTQKKMPLLIATTVVMLFIYIITDIVLSKLIDKIYYSMFA